MVRAQATPASAAPSGAAGGDLDGTYPDPTIADEAVTNAKMADMAQATIKGRASGAGTGAPQDLTGAQVTTILGAAKAYFKANRNATNQTGINQSATTLIQFNNEVFDNGNLFDPVTTFAWTPPAGPVIIEASLLANNAGADSTIQVAIFKDGAVLAQQYFEPIASETRNATVCAFDVANGSNAYDCRITYGANGSGANLVNGANANTYFQGWQL